MRALIVFGILCLPAIAHASTGGDPSVTSLILQGINLVVNAWIASRVGPLTKRVKALESARGVMIE